MLFYIIYYSNWFYYIRWSALSYIRKVEHLSRRTSDTLILNQSMSYFNFIVTALTSLTRYHFYLHFLRKLEEKAPNWTWKMRENMYQQVLWVMSCLLPPSILLTLVYSEDYNINYLLHHVESGSDSGSNAANEPVIDVDYDTLEPSV